MIFSNPILICDVNEEFRALIGDMLTKNGFFHVVEATDTNEAIEYMKGKNDYLVLIDSKTLSNELISLLKKQKDYVIFAENSDPKTALLAAKMGIDRIMSYPFHSRKLLGKINSLL